MRHERLLKKFLITIKMLKKIVLAPKVVKAKSVPKKTKVERIIEESVKLRRRIYEIEEEKKNINTELFKKYFTDYRSPSDMSKKLRETEGKKRRIKYI